MGEIDARLDELQRQLDALRFEYKKNQLNNDVLIEDLAEKLGDKARQLEQHIHFLLTEES